ncbi:MAG: acetoacetate--CoA ligase [Alphaproteobacteria bacterium]
MTDPDTSSNPSAPSVEKPLWVPDPAAAQDSRMAAFQRGFAKRLGTRFSEYHDLWRASVDHPATFWQAILDESDVVCEGTADPVIENADSMPGARFFPGLRLNFAENLLHHARARGSEDAILFWGEDGTRRRLSWAELVAATDRLAGAFHDHGIRPGDRIAAYMPNIPETVIAMLAATKLGAIWSSCSSDFGTRGVVERLAQIRPRILVAADGYFYGGKAHDRMERIAEIAGQLPGLEKIVLVPFLDPQPAMDRLGPHAARTVMLDDLLAAGEGVATAYHRAGFNDPLYVLYSSGTTGLPKGIVHNTGGVLLQHIKEHRLHCDIRPGDRVFYFTTCGWMMWNWLVSALASGATIVLFDGSPVHPKPDILFDLAAETKLTLFGCGAKYLDSVAKENLSPVDSHDLSALRMICSTGSPLVPERFDDVYRLIKKDVCLASISGGTDIVSCFMLGCPTRAVWRGEIQARGLGMAVDVFDEAGGPVRGEKGELVCTRPFPSMPVGFWNDPDGSRYRAAYFERFPGVWCHGDYVELTRHDGLIVYGRSDAVLNPGGVRIGTAEIYRQVEQIPEVLESVAIGQEWQGDVRVVLFVRLREEGSLTDELAATIRERIRANTTPRHVPARIAEVSDIPRTRSGKIVELAIRDVVHGRPVKNRSALANPDALEQFRARPEISA